MTTDDKNERTGSATLEDPSRREFVAISAAVGLAAGASRVRAAESHGHGHMHVVSKDVQVTTGDGTCKASYSAPSSGKHPGVVIWTDIFGLRPTMRKIGAQLAGYGYAVLVPDPFYRTPDSGTFTEEQISKFSFQDPSARALMAKNTGPINMAGAIETDAKAHSAFLSMQSEVNTDKKMGTLGFCMGGPLVFRTLASQPDQFGAGVTFHGGGLVTDKPDSPHLLIAKFQALAYLAIAASDDKRQPDAKDKLKAAFAASSVPQVQKSTATVYEGTFHGWTVPDMPKQPTGEPTYNMPKAEEAWAHLRTTFHTALA